MYFTNKAIAPIKAKRHSDALAIRHNDGIKDLFIKIKQQCRDLINYFKQLPKSKKVVLVLSQILKLASVAYGIYTSKVSAPRVSEKVSGLKKEAEVLNGQIGWRNIENEKLQKTISELKTRLDNLKDLQSRLPSYGMKNLIDPVQKQYNKSQKLYEHYSRQINEKNERIGKINTEIKSTETSLKLKLFISLLGFFISIVGDTAVLRKDAGVKGMKRGQHIKAKNEENAAQKTINYANASDFKKALNDPNHVWDI